MEEKSFFQEGGVTVTNARFIVPSQTFAMSGITSVKAFEEKPSRVWSIIFLVVGILMALGDGDMVVWGVIIAIAGAIGIVLQKSMYHILLTTSSGEAKALSSKNKEWINEIVAALNSAIVHRG